MCGGRGQYFSVTYVYWTFSEICHSSDWGSSFLFLCSWFFCLFVFIMYGVEFYSKAFFPINGLLLDHSWSGNDNVDFFLYTIDIVIRVCFFFFFEMLNQTYVTGQTKLDHVLLYFYMLLDLFPNIFVIYVLEQLCWSTSEEKIHMHIFKLYNLGNFNSVNSVLFISNRDTHIFYFLNQLW